MNTGVIPAIMPHLFEELSDITLCYATFAEWVQIDVMDGVFVPAKSWPFAQNESVQLPVVRGIDFEIHLMVQDPAVLAAAYVAAGAKRIILHAESFKSAAALIQCLLEVKKQGVETGVAFLLETPLDILSVLIQRQCIDVVQLMSISPIGVQGSAFREDVYDRIRLVRLQYPLLPIAVDGGVSEKNIAALVAAGATRVGVGSAIGDAVEPSEAFRHLRDAMHNRV